MASKLPPEGQLPVLELFRRCTINRNTLTYATINVTIVAPRERSRWSELRCFARG
jgi:hypothetical protein